MDPTPTAAHLPAIDYLAVGHVTRDLSAGQSQLGGSVAYAARLAQALGHRPGVVTSAAPDLDLGELAGLPVLIHPATVNTTFENRYELVGRRQRLLARATPLARAQIPPAWRGVPIVHLAPVAGEVADDCLTWDSHVMTGLNLQGWLRAWDDAGRVHYRRWQIGNDRLHRIDVVFVSDEDLASDAGALGYYVERSRCLVLTRGAAGCVVYKGGRSDAVAGYPARVRDPTGAGDVFAAAFLIRWSETRDLEEAARFANAAASLCTEQIGLAGVPDRAAIERRQL